MVKINKEYPKRLSIDAVASYKVSIFLKTKYLFTKSQYDLTSIDKECNKLKIKNESAEPGKMLVIFNEYPKKLLEFNACCDKYTLQTLSKLEVAMPKNASSSPLHKFE